MPELSDNLISLAAFAAALAVVWLVSGVTAVKDRVVPSQAPRIAGLDGMRGILAIAVFGHHCAALRSLAQQGIWSEPQGNIANLMGQMAVAVFFMVSAFLFLGKLFESNGELRLPSFIWGRITRLTPVYLVAVAIAISIVFAFSGFQLQEPLSDILSENFGWIGFGFFRLNDLNQVAHSMVMLSPTWSLRYEWILYAGLPVAAWALRAGAPRLLIVAALFGAGWFNPWFVYFGFGALAALLIPKQPQPTIWGSLALIGILLALSGFHDATHILVMPLAFVLFLLCLSDARLTSFLDRRTFLFAGQISYTVYLLHLPVLFGAATLVFSLDRLGRWSDAQFLGFVTGVAILVIILAICVHLLVELPGARLGKMVHKPRPRWRGTAESGSI